MIWSNFVITMISIIRVICNVKNITESVLPTDGLTNLFVIVLELIPFCLLIDIYYINFTLSPGSIVIMAFCVAG